MSTNPCYIPFPLHTKKEFPVTQLAVIEGVPVYLKHNVKGKLCELAQKDTILTNVSLNIYTHFPPFCVSLSFFTVNVFFDARLTSGYENRMPKS